MGISLESAIEHQALFAKLEQAEQQVTHGHAQDRAMKLSGSGGPDKFQRSHRRAKRIRMAVTWLSVHAQSTIRSHVDAALRASTIISATTGIKRWDPRLR